MGNTFGRRTVMLPSAAEKRHQEVSSKATPVAVATMEELALQDKKIGLHNELERDLELDNAAEPAFDFLVYPVGLSFLAAFIYWGIMQKRLKETLKNSNPEEKAALEAQINANTSLLASKGTGALLGIALASTLFKELIEDELNATEGIMTALSLEAVFVGVGIYFSMWAATQLISSRYSSHITINEKDAAAERKAYATVISLYTFVLHLCIYRVENNDDIPSEAYWAGFIVVFTIVAAMIYHAVPRATEGFKQAAEAEGCTNKMNAFAGGFLNKPVPKDEAEAEAEALEGEDSESGLPHPSH